MLEYLESFITQVEPWMAYLILFVSAFVENTFPPVPGDTVTVFGAYLITTGKLGFTGVLLSTSAGSVLGFMTMYFAGRLLGRDFFNEKRARIFKAKRMDKVERWFHKYGYGVILANRFLSGTRSVISLFAGIFHLRWFMVFLLSSVSAIVWNGLLMWAGYVLGVNWENITELISRYNQVVIALTLILVVAFFIYRRNKKKKKKENVAG